MGFRVPRSLLNLKASPLSTDKTELCSHYGSAPVLLANKGIHIQNYQLSTFCLAFSFFFSDNDSIKSVKGQEQSGATAFKQTVTEVILQLLK